MLNGIPKVTVNRNPMGTVSRIPRISGGQPSKAAPAARFLIFSFELKISLDMEPIFS
jgi:hypothetical protein